MRPNPFLALRPLGLGLVGSLGLAVSAAALEFGGDNDITAVSGRTGPDYVRSRDAAGLVVPESYVFGKGGAWKGAMPDDSIDPVSFLDIAHTIAHSLATAAYLPGRDPGTTRLLIMVYWGTTHAPEHANESDAYSNLQSLQATLSASLALSNAAKPAYDVAATQRYGSGAEWQVAGAIQSEMDTAMGAVNAQNNIRDQSDIINVQMLGYDSWWTSSQRYKDTPMDHERRDLLSEIEENRYFVVLMAYDFQLLRLQRRHKLLWETRFSIRQRHHLFDHDLPAMAAFAASYFGQDSHGLVRKEIPAGQVQIGNLKSLGSLPEKGSTP